jgi:NAD(P)-dependent dehydrogenase (short-subunit alcohol dehydrogenase family)
VKVLVTGATGRVGRPAVARLASRGHEVLAVGRAPTADIPGARYAPCDLFDARALADAMTGADAVVHLAAIPGPGGFFPHEVFHANALGTFTVYEAAARAGVKRVVAASSINAFGYNFGARSFPITLLPVDEAQGGFTTDAYSFSKQVTESIGDYAWRRDGIGGFCLRLPWVAPAVHSSREVVQAHAARCRASWETLMALSAAERQARVDAWIAAREKHYAGRHQEGRGPHLGWEFPDPLMEFRTDFWTRIDERDAALCIELALHAEIEGCRVLFVNDGCNITGIPSVPLARLFFPGARVQEDRVPGSSALVCMDAARDALGFEPEHPTGRWL